MFYSVDRIEQNLAVLIGDDGHTLDVPLSALPGAVREGTMLVKEQNGAFRIDKAEEIRRKDEIRKLQKGFDENRK